MKLPKTIYVAVHNLPNDDPYFAADAEQGDLVEDDGPTEVGTYRLVETNTIRKVITKEKGKAK